MFYKVDFKAISFFLLMMSYVSVALYTGLSGGTILGAFYLIFILLSLRFNRLDWILVIYLMWFFFGAFKLLRWDHGFYFDATLFISCLFFVYLLSRGLIHRYLIVLFFLIISSSLLNFENYQHYVYTTIGFFCYFVVLGVLIDKIGFRSKFVSNFSVLLFFSSIVIYIFQMLGVIPSLYQTDSVSVCGILLYKPGGFTGAIYQAGTKLLFSYFLYLYFLKSSSFRFLDNKIVHFIVFCLTMFLCTLSQKSIFLGLLVFLVYYVVYCLIAKFNNNRHIKPLYVFIILAFLFFAAFLSTSLLLPYADASNAFKVFMWMEVFNSFYQGGPIDWLFGFGLGSTQQLMEGKDFTYLADQYSIRGWDIQVFNKGIFPHNVLVQIIYELGIVCFFIYIFIVMKILSFISTYKSYHVFILFLVVFLINYLLHNGIVSVVLSFMVLCLSFKKKVNNNEVFRINECVQK